MHPSRETVYTLSTMRARRKTASPTPRLLKVDAAAFATDLSKKTGPTVADLHTATDQIVGAVIQAIVEHRLKPGTKLVEQTMGNRFGVSRTLVRQALFRLQQMRLVTLEPARGAFVAQPSLIEAREVFAVRRMLEGQMLRGLAGRLSPEMLHRLNTHLRAEQDAVARIDVAARTRLLFDFHVLLAELSANTVLTELMKELVSRCALISLMYQSASHAGQSHAEHVALVAALEKGDGSEALHLLDAHLSSVEQQLTERPRVPT